MKNKFLLYIPAVLFLFISANPGKEVNKDEVLMKVTLAGLDNTHFSPATLNDDFSLKLFDLYLKRVDYSKRFFTQDDVDMLSSYKTKLDEEMKNGTSAFFDLANELLDKRVNQAESFYKEILASPIDFTIQESFETDPEKAVYITDEASFKESWRKLIKYQVMMKIYDIEAIQEKAKPDSTGTASKKKSFEEIEKEAREKVTKTISELFTRMKKLDRKDRMGIYLNCVANIYDPHTEYFSPEDKDNFDIGMSGQLEGIGAQLQETEGNIKVSSIVPGSPSWKQGKLQAGDIILTVAQGNDEPVDVVGMRLEDVVKLVRGKKGTTVKLSVKKPDGTITSIAIVRDVVVLEETYAKSAIINDEKTNQPVGYIYLPKFYADFSKPGGGRSCSKDVAKELEKLKKEGVTGVVLDLRNNGGGSLEDVVDMVGLFIPSGPVVQVKSKSGAPYILEDRNSSVLYDGPLVVMINEFSASASEILAAAIQDYKRGVIVGTTTFGKGTVQRFYDLDNFLSNEYSSFRPLGQMKVTTQKFYRVNGQSTQLKGVSPDVVFPDLYAYLEVGEKNMDFPLQWDIIQAAKYQPTNSASNLDKLTRTSNARTSNSAIFKMIKENAERLKIKKDETIFSLNYETFKKEMAEDKEVAKKFEDAKIEIPSFKVTTLSEENSLNASDTSRANRTMTWHKSIKKDAFLFEAMHIAYDIKK